MSASIRYEPDALASGRPRFEPKSAKGREPDFPLSGRLAPSITSAALSAVWRVPTDITLPTVGCPVGGSEGGDGSWRAGEAGP